MSDRQIAPQGDFAMGGLTNIGNTGSGNPDLSWQERRRGWNGITYFWSE